MKIETSQDSFVGGELAPSLFGRTDIAQYANACQTIENLLVRPYGALTSCPGTEFVNDAKYDTVVGGNDENTILLLHMNGTNGSTTFIDSSTGGVDSPHTVTVSGATTISTAQSVFGGASASFINTSSSIYIPDSEDWSANNSWTIDFWVRFSSLPASGQSFFFLDHNFAAGPTRMFLDMLKNNSDGLYYLQFTTQANAGSNQKSYATSPQMTTNTWYHVAYVRSSNTISIYQDGNLLGSDSLNTFFIGNPSNSTLFIGRPGAAAAGFLDGNLDEFRWSKIVRWTSSFTVPDAEYSNDGDQDGIAERVYGRARLIPFIFSKEDAYIIECGSQYFRFYTDGAVVTE